MSADLKPCPFCGVAPALSEYAVNDDGDTKWAVGCDCRNAPEDQPYAERYIHAHGSTSHEAIAAWNTRAEGPAPVSAPLDREAIARVIETTYWPLVDKWGRNTSNEYWNTRIEASLAKADAILALTGQQDHVGLTTPAVEGRGDRSEAIAYFEAFVKRKDEMDRMGYGLRAEEWPEFVATMRATLTGEGCGETYRNWHIRYDPPPIPSRASDWHFAHSDFDGAPDANDNRCGRAASLEAAKAEIDAWIEENFDCRCSAAIPADCMALTCKWRAT